MGPALRNRVSECDSYSYFNVYAMRLPCKVGIYVQVAAYSSVNSSCIQQILQISTHLFKLNKLLPVIKEFWNSLSKYCM